MYSVDNNYYYTLSITVSNQLQKKLLKIAVGRIKALNNMDLFPHHFKFKYATSIYVHFRPCLPYKMIQRKH